MAKMEPRCPASISGLCLERTEGRRRPCDAGECDREEFWRMVDTAKAEAMEAKE